MQMILKFLVIVIFKNRFNSYLVFEDVFAQQMNFSQPYNLKTHVALQSMSDIALSVRFIHFKTMLLIVET